MEKIFADGAMFRTPPPGAPEFLKLRISVRAKEFIEWLAKHQDEGGWVNIDVKESKGGKLYGELNTFRAKKKDDVPF